MNTHDNGRRVSRRQVIEAAGASGVLGLAGCTSDSGNSGGSTSSGSATQLTFWHQEGVPHRQEQFQAITQQFNESHDDIKVSVEPQNWNEVFGKLTSALDAGNPPDFMFSLPAFTMTFQGRDALVDVSDIVEDINDENNMYENTIAPFQYEGGTWGIPMWDMVFQNHYRTDTLGQTSSWPPETWEEWISANAEVTDGEQYGMVLPANKNLWTTESLYTLMIQKDAYVYGPDGGVMFDTQETVETLDFYKRMFNQASTPSATGWSWAEWERSLLQGNAQSTVGFSSWMRSLTETEYSNDFDAIQQPAPADGRQGSVHYVNNVMAFNEDKKDAIGSFVKWLHGENIYGDWLAKTEPTLYLPVTETGQNADAFWNHDVVSQYEESVRAQFEALPNATVYGFRDIHVENDLYLPSVGTLEGSSVLGEVVQELIVNDRSPAEAATWGQDRIQEVLEVDASGEL